MGYWDRYLLAYDKVLATVKEYRLLQRMHSEGLIKCNTVLDSGCGNGRVTELLAKAGCKVVSFDIDMSAPAFTRVYASRSFVGVQGDGCCLPLKESSFEGISSMLVLFAVTDPLVYLREHFRVLSKGGKLILSGADLASVSLAPKILEYWKSCALAEGVSAEYWDDFFALTRRNVTNWQSHWFTLEQVLELCIDAGFTIEGFQRNLLYWDTGYFVVARK